MLFRGALVLMASALTEPQLDKARQVGAFEKIIIFPFPADG